MTQNKTINNNNEKNNSPKIHDNEIKHTTTKKKASRLFFFVDNLRSDFLCEGVYFSFILDYITYYDNDLIFKIDTSRFSSNN